MVYEEQPSEQLEKWMRIDRREERMARLEQENAVLWRLAHLIGYDSLEAIEEKLAEVRELWG